MMWILPKQLISAFAQDTEALTLDSGECSQTCAQSLMRRSKPSPAKTYLREWKAGNLMRLRSGAISSPSLGKPFTTWWTSLVEATLASPSPHRDYARGPEMKGTCGPILQKELPFCDQASASLKMSKVTLPLGSVTYCNSWESWVTDRRGEYSARLNVARHTSESDYSYLPTPCANEDSFRLNGNSQQSKTLEAKARRGELKTIGSAINVSCLSLTAAHATMLNLNVLSVASGHTHLCGVQKTHVPHVEQTGQAGVTQQRGPLNPQFVEVMMGLPIGWTDCAYLATESFQPQQP
jgi:hypothetical protein